MVKNFRCVHCDQLFHNHSEYISHVRSNHLNNEDGEISLENQPSTSHRFYCQLCKESFQSRIQFTNHIRSEHMKERHDFHVLDVTMYIQDLQF